jgi:hypothetical protein
MAAKISENQKTNLQRKTISALTAAGVAGVSNQRQPKWLKAGKIMWQWRAWRHNGGIISMRSAKMKKQRQRKWRQAPKAG